MLDARQKNRYGQERPSGGGCFQLGTKQQNCRREIARTLRKDRRTIDSAAYRRAAAKRGDAYQPDDFIAMIDKAWPLFTRDLAHLDPSPYPNPNLLDPSDPQRFTALYAKRNGTGLRYHKRSLQGAPRSEALSTYVLTRTLGAGFCQPPQFVPIAEHDGSHAGRPD